LIRGFFSLENNELGLRGSLLQGQGCLVL